MMGLPLAFGAPLVLAGLITLPIIWWLLRLTPPKPNEEIFPPLEILLKLIKKEETPNKSPWWLTLLRLTLAGLAILALAEPVLNPRNVTLRGEGPVAIVIDNSWPSAVLQERQLRTAREIVETARASSRPIILIGTASGDKVPVGPFSADEALERLAAVKPAPLPSNPLSAPDIIERLDAAKKPNEIAWLSAGLESKDEQKAFEQLRSAGVKLMLWYTSEAPRHKVIVATENRPESLRLTLRQLEASQGAMTGQILAFDERGRQLAEVPIVGKAEGNETIVDLTLPVELRNEIASVKIAGESHAAAVRLLDDRMRRKRVALVSGANSGVSEPLLAPLYYIEKSLAPFADIALPKGADLASSISQLLAAKPEVLVLADVGALSEGSEQIIDTWVNKGGILIRFAGPRLAAAQNDNLLPVELRRGERALDGSMSWTVPQGLLPFDEASPFAGIELSADILVSRQVLAKPTPDLAENSWADLADGTPLVTAKTVGRGRIILFHVTPTASWSNLPLTGTFVEMLRRSINPSATGPASNSGRGQSVLPPFRMIGPDGAITAPPANAQPLSMELKKVPEVSFENPPGLYGSSDGAISLNLLQPDARLVAAKPPTSAFSLITQGYSTDETRPLKGYALMIALGLLALDCLAVLWLGGAFRSAPGAAAIAILTCVIVAQSDNQAVAQESKAPSQSETQAVEAISKTRLAYVLTGSAEIDKTSEQGMFGLSVHLGDKTALEPGDPAGVDLEKDELAFFPMIYWPIDADAPAPSLKAVSRADAYMRQGGTILFDTRDEDTAGLDLSGGGSPANQRLRQILAEMNVPALEPVPTDHVLTKAFYLLDAFPGRFAGGSLWVEASTPVDVDSERPARTGDGVSPIMITSNDFASAWAMDANGYFLFSTVPASDVQREQAFRTGINIVMYMLTGNYKSDQVHIPALLERLGQ
jgi:Domain of unknown function (DUF4159)/Aerotolerance regulator N-terminal